MAIEDLIHPYLGQYTKAPQWVKTSLGGVYSWLPASVRFGMHYPRFLEETLLTDPVEIARRARAKLAMTLQWAVETVPVYRYLRDARPVDGDPEHWLHWFPLLSKEDLKHQEASHLSTAMRPAQRLMAYTGGSTSVPMRLFLEKHVSRSKDFAYNGAFDRIAGIGSQDVIMALRGRTVRGAECEGGPIWMFDPIKRYLHLSSDHLEPEHMPRYVEALRRWKPTYIHAFPSALYPIARWLEDHPAPDVARRIHCIQLFSENVYEYQVELMRNVFGCPVLLDYGHSERAAKAISLPRDDRYFFWPLYGKVELIDFEGRFVTAPGVLGEIVATGFDNRVMPLIRYRTGDLAMWSQRPNKTRPGFPVAERIEGRLQEFLVCADNRLVSITTIGVAHFEQLAGVERMQFEQSQPGHAVLKVETRDPLPRSACEALIGGIRDKTQDGLAITIEEVERIPRTSSGKHKLLVQHLDISGYLGAASVEDAAVA
jgi:phenylacetate-CoA ligase